VLKLLKVSIRYIKRKKEMKSIILLLLVLGVMMITTGYHQKMQENFKQEKIIEYRYIPRSLFEEQIEPVNLQQSFYDMFQKNNVFIGRR
jgi:hypothetical protein